MAIETMVLFDLQLRPLTFWVKPASADEQLNEARWNPDLSTLVHFPHKGFVKPVMAEKV